MSNAALVLAQVQNPLPLMLDKLGLMSGDYVVKLRNGPRFKVRSKSSDAYSVYETAMRGGGYFEFAVPKPGDTVIDIGANIGVFAVLAARMVGPTGRVIAIEPHPDTANHLRQNISLNGLTNVTVRQVAVAGATGTAAFHAGDKPLFGSLLSQVNGRPIEGRAEEVPSITLSELLLEQKISHIDFLKIDCEGSEYAIFDTMPRQLWSQISQIVMEAHAVVGRKTSELSERLRSEGYDIRESELVFAVRRQTAADGRPTAT